MKQSKLDGILSKCCNLYGNSLSIQSRRKIKQFIINPNAETWDKICGIIIWNTPMINIWTQLSSTDHTFNVVGRNYQLEGEEWKQVSEWRTIPSPMEVIIAIRKLHEEDSEDDDDSEESSPYKFNSEVKEIRNFNRKN